MAKVSGKRIIEKRHDYEDGAFHIMVVTKLPVGAPPEFPNGLKIRLYYIDATGTPILGYDCHTGKPLHKFYKGQDYPYTFVSLAQAIADFQRDIQEERNGK